MVRLRLAELASALSDCREWYTDSGKLETKSGSLLTPIRQSLFEDSISMPADGYRDCRPECRCSTLQVCRIHER